MSTQSDIDEIRLRIKRLELLVVQLAPEAKGKTYCELTGKTAGLKEVFV